jgi:hypothetical protein
MQTKETRKYGVFGGLHWLKVSFYGMLGKYSVMRHR